MCIQTAPDSDCSNRNKIGGRGGVDLWQNYNLWVEEVGEGADKREEEEIQLQEEGGSTRKEGGKKVEGTGEAQKEETKESLGSNLPVSQTAPTPFHAPNELGS